MFELQEKQLIRSDYPPTRISRRQTLCGLRQLPL